MRSLRSVRASRAGVSFVTGLVLAAALVASAAHASYPGDDGLLSVSYGFDCPGSRVAVLEPDGRSLRMLTPSSCPWGRRVGRASWSPDGRWLIFDYELPPSLASNREWSRMAIMRADGSKRRDMPLAPAPVRSVPGFGDEEATFFRSEPTFTSDGRHLLYTRTLREPPQYPGDSWSYPFEIWSAALDGSLDHRLGVGRVPRMSPDGRRIAYIQPRDEDGFFGDVSLMSARTGRPLRRLWRGFAWSIDWSPDGTRILFTGSRSSSYPQVVDVYSVRTNGTGLRRLTSTPKTSEREAVWSPNGRRIAVVRESRRPFGDCCETITQSIWTMRSDGTSQERIRPPWIGNDEDGKGPVQISWQPCSLDNPRGRQSMRLPTSEVWRAND